MYPVQTVELAQPCKRAMQDVGFESCGGTRRGVHFAKKRPPTQFFLQIGPLSWERNGTLGGLIGCAAASPHVGPPWSFARRLTSLRPPIGCTCRLPSRSRSALVAPLRRWPPAPPPHLPPSARPAFLPQLETNTGSKAKGRTGGALRAGSRAPIKGGKQYCL
jgi:hypothetical protein